MLESQYILSLDSLDLSFLSQYVKKSAEDKRVLWSRPSLKDETTYYEVELVTEEVPEKDSYLHPETFATFKCHICNTEVPEIYYKQHIKSKKHQRYKRLSELVLEKVSKQINFDIDNIFGNDNKVQAQNTFYCEYCSIVVPEDRKIKHNKSYCHLKSIENDKLINNFISIYEENNNIAFEHKNQSQHITTKKDDINAEDKSLSDVEKNNETQCVNSSDVFFINNATKIKSMDHKSVGKKMYDSNRDEKTLYTNGTTMTVNNVTILDNIYEQSNESSDTDWGQSDNETELCNGIDYTNKLTKKPYAKSDALSDKLDMSSLTLNDKKYYLEISYFKAYMEDMIALYKLNYDVPLVEGYSIVIVSPKGYKEKITVDVFHGFHWLNGLLNGVLNCQLCNEFVDSDSILHIKSPNHVKNITKPVNDEFARETIRNDNWAHCLLCNEIVQVGPKHYAAVHSNHKKCTQERTTTKPNNIPETNYNGPKKIYCLVCKVHIDGHNFLGHTKDCIASGQETEHKVLEVRNRNPYSSKSGQRVAIRNADSIKDFITYMKWMNHIYYLKYKIPVTEGNSIVICTTKGHKANISIDSFHGFNRLHALKFVYCQLCNKFIDMDTNQHAETESHYKNIIKPINEHFARELVNHRKWTHCVLCNEIVQAESNHASISPKHTAYRQESTPEGNITINGKIVPKKPCGDIFQFASIKNVNNSLKSTTSKHARVVAQTDLKKQKGCEPHNIANSFLSAHKIANSYRHSNFRREN